MRFRAFVSCVPRSGNDRRLEVTPLESAVYRNPLSDPGEGRCEMVLETGWVGMPDAREPFDVHWPACTPQRLVQLLHRLGDPRMIFLA